MHKENHRRARSPRLARWLTFIATCAVVALVALAASLVPAWRATTIAPREALR